MYPNLKIQLWKKHIRQNQLARLLHIDETVVSKIINGSRRPSQELRTRIAEVLESDEEWLFRPADKEEVAAPGPPAGDNGALPLW
jgi:transcriptional regulator with XRE-family HTH domain